MSIARPTRRLLIPLYLAIVLVVAGGTIAYGALSKTVTLSVDGKTQTVRTFGDDVSAVLEARGVEVGLDDRVTPAEATSISDGDVVKVQYARPLTLSVDGEKKTVTTWETRVDRALRALGVQPEQGAYVSRSLSSRVPLDGASVVVSNPKQVVVHVDGKKRKLSTTAPTVAAVLDEANVSYDEDDEIKPGLKTLVKDDVKVKVVDIRTVTRTEKVAVDHETTVREDDDALKGKVTVVTKGKDGVERQRVRLVMADGKVRKRTVLSSEVTREPVTQVEEHGTKAPDSAPSVAGNSVWDKIAKCESGGNWHINSGNGYYGGLQFSAATWHSVGGPGLPHQHSRETQIKYAKILQARSGWGQWSCSSMVGVG